MTSTDAVLLPRPRSLRLASRGRVDARPIAHRVDRTLPPEGYRLELSEDGVHLLAGDAAGIFYGQITLAQLRRLRADGTLPAGVVEDWPDLAVRAVMLDVSRDKVPTMDTLKALVDRLSGWKINQVQLYMEHTFAYQEHPEVWAGASPLTSDEITDLEGFCADRHIELVPNVNCLGHMERWLRHERHRHLAIRPEGRTSTSGRWWPPTTMDPSNPGSLELVRSLLAELLPNFGSRLVHVGLDEPWELPPERMADYLEYASQLRAAPETDGREMLMWGDILASHPGAEATLPDGVTVCEWGYEDWWPFDARCRTLAAAGRPFWVCPGTSSWLSILGRTTNAIGNMRIAAEAAAIHGATGYLTTDWGDRGHLQYLPVSEPGLAAGAAMSWCLETNRGLDPGDLAAALDLHAFEVPARGVGQALVELGDVHRLVTCQVPNMSVLCLPLYYPNIRLGEGITAGLDPTELIRAEEAVGAALDGLTSRQARARGADGRGAGDGAGDGQALVVEELQTSADLVMLLCRDGRARLAGDGTLASVPAACRRQLAVELDRVIARHHDLWLARNRPGGLADSTAQLRRLLDGYGARQ